MAPVVGKIIEYCLGWYGYPWRRHRSFVEGSIPRQIL